MHTPPFQPAWWLPGPHLQTLWPVRFRKRPELDLRRERVELSDGDFIDLDWYGEAHLPLVLINHGLEGSIHSHYARPLMQKLRTEGFASLFMHFRNCSGTPNRLARSYHSGETGDVQAIIQHVQHKHNRTPFAAIGFSLGGNMLLKWLGESGDTNPLKCAVAVSVPFQLDDSARKLSTGFSRLYQWHLLRSLKQAYKRKFSTRTSPLNVELDQLNSFRAFDNDITAALHGFKDVDDYYSQCSSRQYLPRIHIPTCIIHALDDPFMYPASVPDKHELSEQIELQTVQRGGHVGFVTGPSPWHAQYWHEQVITRFLQCHYNQADSRHPSVT